MNIILGFNFFVVTNTPKIYSAKITMHWLNMETCSIHITLSKSYVNFIVVHCSGDKNAYKV